MRFETMHENSSFHTFSYQGAHEIHLFILQLQHTKCIKLILWEMKKS